MPRRPPPLARYRYTPQKISRSERAQRLAARKEADHVAGSDDLRARAWPLSLTDLPRLPLEVLRDKSRQQCRRIELADD